MMTLNLPVKLVNLRLRDDFNSSISRFVRKMAKNTVFGIHNMDLRACGSHRDHPPTWK